MKDALRGTYVWKHERLSCPSTISQIYRGLLKFYINSSDTNLEGGLAVLEREDQIAGLEITTSFSLPLLHGSMDDPHPRRGHCSP